MKSLVAVGLFAMGGMAHAETITVTDPADFASPTPYALGGNTVTYAGASATVDNSLSVSGANGTLCVKEAETTLTWAGAVTAGKTFFTQGLGTLVFTGSVANGDMKRTDAGTTVFRDSEAVTFSTYYLNKGTLQFDGANVGVGKLLIGNETAGINPRCELKNGAVVKNREKVEDELDSGIRIGSSSDIMGTMELTGGSKLSHVGVGVRANSKLTVGANSTLSFSRPLLSDSFGPTAVFGDVLVNGGTLKSFDSSDVRVTDMRWAQWFNGVTNLYVGSLGATFEAPSDLASLWPRLTADADASGAAVTKTGTGSLAIRATTLPVTVSAGDLRLAVAESNGTLQDQVGETTFASGTSATLAGFRSAAQTDLSSAPTVKFHPAGVEAIRGQWQRNGWASIRPDGYLQLSDSRAESSGKRGVGSVFRKDKVAVDESFNLDFSVVEWNIRGGSWHNQNGGFALVFQNSASGTSAVATESESESLCGYGAALQDNAFALLFYAPANGNRTVSVANGSTITEIESTNSEGQNTSYATLDKPVRIGFAYDATQKKATVTWLTLAKNIATPQKTWTFDIDLVSAVGADMAYLGFTGACGAGWRNSVFTIGNVARTTAATRAAVAYPGGTLDLSAGATRAFRTFGDKAHAGFLMESLAYGDQTALDIAPLNASDPAASFVGFENFSGAGTLVKRGAGNFGLVSEQAKEVALKVEAGGLVVRKATDVPTDPLDWDWAYSDGFHGYEWPMLGAHGGITVGDTISTKGYCATTRRKFDITGNWRFSVDIYPKGLMIQKDGGAHSERTDRQGMSLGFAFHDDPRGIAYQPLGNSKCAGLNNSLKYGAGMALCTCSTCGENRRFGPLMYGTSADAACTSVQYSSGAAEIYTENQVTNGSVLHVTMEYAAATGVMSYTVRHNDEAGYTRTYTDDLTKRIPSGRARLILSTANKKDDVAIECEYANMKFERLDAPTATAETVLASLTTTAASVPVRLENATNAAFRVGAATLPAAGTLAVTAPYAAATLELGTLAAADSCPTLDLGDNVTVSVDAATGVKTLTVAGGVLKLTSATALPDTARLVLSDDARLALDFSGRLAIRSIERNGVKVASGKHSAQTEAWIFGAGEICTGRGLVMLFR